jgi:uncharacterized YccA/Bax inhibitor family protein
MASHIYLLAQPILVLIGEERTTREKLLAVSLCSKPGLTILEACHRLDTEVTERNLTVDDTVKIAVFTVLAIAGFFVLWGMTFVLCFALTLNIALSSLLGLLTSAATIFALIAVFKPPRRKVHMVLSKRQKIGIYVAWIMIFASNLPMIRINLKLFLGFLPILVFGTFFVIYGTLRSGKEMAQK